MKFGQDLCYLLYTYQSEFKISVFVQLLVLEYCCPYSSFCGSVGVITGSVEVAGRIAGIELENFMCHGRLKIAFDTESNNCFYIGGPNGSELVSLLLFCLPKSHALLKVEKVRCLLP